MSIQAPNNQIFNWHDYKTGKKKNTEKKTYYTWKSSPTS